MIYVFQTSKQASSSGEPVEGNSAVTQSNMDESGSQPPISLIPLFMYFRPVSRLAVLENQSRVIVQ